MSPPEDQCVSLHVQVALAGQKVQSEEAVVAPAFTNLKVRGKLPNDVLGWVTGGLMDHLHTVLIPTQNQDNVTIHKGKCEEKQGYNLFYFILYMFAHSQRQHCKNSANAHIEDVDYCLLILKTLTTY